MVYNKVILYYCTIISGKEMLMEELLIKLNESGQQICFVEWLQINCASALTFSSFMLQVVKVAQVYGSKGELGGWATTQANAFEQQDLKAQMGKAPTFVKILLLVSLQNPFSRELCFILDPDYTTLPPHSPVALEPIMKFPNSFGCTHEGNILSNILIPSLNN